MSRCHWNASIHFVTAQISFLQVIGALMVGVGVIGMLGAFNNNKDLLNFHIVGAILAILLSFQFVGSVCCNFCVVFSTEIYSISILFGNFVY